MKKNKIIIWVCALIFGGLGIYFTFIDGNINKYDSQTKAYSIYPNETYDSDGDTVYKPIYYFKVDNREYKCISWSGSSVYPNEGKNTVYYDSSDPTKCRTEYEKSSSKIVGIICLVGFVIIFYFFIIKKPQDVSDTYEQVKNFDNNVINSEQTQKIIGIVNKVQLIYKRVIIAIVIIVLLIFTLIDTALLKQTIKSNGYMETTAVYLDTNENGGDSIFKDCIYKFTDNNGNEQQITISIARDNEPENELHIRYNENNPQDFYEDSARLDKSGIIWYIVKIVAIILLIFLFFNKKILSKISMTSSVRR